jgi:hypothetical protein
MLSIISDTVSDLLPARKRHNASSGWTSFDAPCCVHKGETADTRGRGGIRFETDHSIVYNCFNCGFVTGHKPGQPLGYKFRKFMKWLGADENTIRRLVIEAIRVRDVIAPETSVTPEPETEVNFRICDLPAQAVSFSEWRSFLSLTDSDYVVPDELSQAVKYITDRHIDLDRYEFYWTAERSYNLHHRIIIPCYWQNQIIGYTARAWDPDVKPKYHSHYESGYVFNVDKQQPHSKFVIVTEGPFDAMAIDGVAVLGSECSEQQADIIDALTREVIVVPDADRAGAKLVDAALEYGWTVSYPVWQSEYKDVSEAVRNCGKLFVLKTILDARETGRLKIELLKKRLLHKHI